MKKVNTKTTKPTKVAKVSKKRKTRQSKDVMVSLKKLRAYSYSHSGLSGEKVGQIMGKSARTISRYRQDVDQALFTSEDWAIAKAQIITLLLPSVGVVDMYLKGDGEAVGGDLRAAFKMLESFYLLKPEQAADKIDQHVSIHNADIKIINQENTVFAAVFIESFERVLGAVKNGSGTKGNSK